LKHKVDDEARDMAALLVYCFREIDAGIDESVRAWEKRDYWVKAEQFRLRWAWVGKAADDLHQIIMTDEWDRLPPTLIKLLPEFRVIKISKFTRKPTRWQGSYNGLMRENSNQLEARPHFETLSALACDVPGLSSARCLRRLCRIAADLRPCYRTRRQCGRDVRADRSPRSGWPRGAGRRPDHAPANRHA